MLRENLVDDKRRLFPRSDRIQLVEGIPKFNFVLLEELSYEHLLILFCQHRVDVLQNRFGCGNLRQENRIFDGNRLNGRRGDARRSRFWRTLLLFDLRLGFLRRPQFLVPRAGNDNLQIGKTDDGPSTLVALGFELRFHVVHPFVLEEHDRRIDGKHRPVFGDDRLRYPYFDELEHGPQHPGQLYARMTFNNLLVDLRNQSPEFFVAHFGKSAVDHVPFEDFGIIRVLD